MSIPSATCLVLAFFRGLVEFMSIKAYYNDNDQFCCNWLSNLMDAGLITPGKIDDRPIQEINPDALVGFQRVHFFAGIAGWDHALDLAGWGERRVFTGSCPCQPFSAAGNQKGEADSRHLWPEFRRLIAECRPQTIFGEQVASKLGREWLANVRFDLEHIECWSRFYKNLHTVRVEAAKGKLPQVLGEIIRWIATDLQKMSAPVRDVVEEFEQGAASENSKAPSREGEILQADLRRDQPRKTPGNAGEAQIAGEGDPLRSTQLHSRDRSQSPEGSLRTDGPEFQFSQQRDQLEFSIVGSDRSQERIHPQQHSNCLFCNERCDGELGLRYATDDHVCLAGKEIANDDIRLAEAFRVALASKLGREWLARVRADLEELGYAVGAADLCAAGVGAPHIRQRLFWVANTNSGRCQQRDTGQRAIPIFDSGRVVGGLADTASGGLGVDGSASRSTGHADERGATDRMGDTAEYGREQSAEDAQRREFEPVQSSRTAWSDFDIIPCADGKARRVKSRYVKISDGLSGAVVPCGDSDREKEETINGEAEATRSDQVLRSVQENTQAKNVSECNRGQNGVQEAPILRPKMHGSVDGGAHQGSNAEELPPTVGKDSAGGMRILLPHRTTTCPSRGREPAEQCDDELEDFVQLLPSSFALAELYGDTATQKAMLALLETIGAQGSVQYSPNQIQEAWRSASSEARKRFGDAYRQTRWLRTIDSPLAVGAVNRVGRLKGYGNAIVPEAAVRFIRSFIEATEGVEFI